MRGGAGRAGASRFKGISWVEDKSKWLACYKGKHLGLHTTEEIAALALCKYLKDGSASKPPDCLGLCSSQFKGVTWNKDKNKWKTECNGTYLGYHATEEDAARAYIKYLNYGIDLVKHREVKTSLFTGVSWYKMENKWRAKCTGKYLGLYTTEEAAAQAYNVEAGRVGRPLNVIPPAGAVGTGVGLGAGGGAGPKRATPKTPAPPAASKKTKRAAPTTSAAPAASKKMKL
jgi:hypothetical protein